MKTRFLSLIVPALLALFQLNARAEDIDLFTGAGSGVVAQAPNLLFIMDNAGAFSASATYTCVIKTGVGTATTTFSGGLAGTVGGVEQCALYNVIDSLPVTSTATVKIGIMMYNDNGVVPFDGVKCGDYAGAKSGNPGGCLMYPLTEFTTATKGPLLTWIKTWKNSGSGTGQIKANAEQTAATMQEAWAYFFGKTGISGRNYLTSAPNTNCKNFIVFIGNAVGANGTPGDSAASGNGPMQSLLGTNTSNTGANADPIATTKQRELLTLANAAVPGATARCGTVNFPADNNHDSRGFYADEWARYLYANRVRTYTVGFVGDGCKPDYPWLLTSMANQGDGQYFETTDYSELVTALQNIFSEVRSVNSVFAAVTLPVSVNTQGAYLNQVFIGMFRPDADGLPRWLGNLKQYKLGKDPSSGKFGLVDADGIAATSSTGSEFVQTCARSFWTEKFAEGSGDGYWTQLEDPNCTGYPASSNSPDGNMVEKGGQAYMLRKRTPSTRVVRTCSPTVASCLVEADMRDFDTSNAVLTASMTTALGTSTSPTAAELIDWARGKNNKTPIEPGSLNGNTLTVNDMRPSSHGDVVHSRPAAANFGTDAVPKVVVFYASNDGMLRAINGNQTSTFTVNSVDVEAGQEFWSFVPPEFYGKVLRRYRNSQGISSAAPKDYGMDGPLAVHRLTNGDAWIFATMRRGGRAMYAFHVNGTTLAITLMWKRGCGDDGSANCSSADFVDIAQTWSAPTVFTAKGHSGGTTPLLMIGGGYDAACEDVDAVYACAASARAKKIYLLDAATGAYVHSFTTERGVVADMTVLTDTDGHANLIYTADLGGNVYRISGSSATTAIGTTAPTGWTMTTIASLGCDTLTTSCDNRKFMFAPEVVIDGSDYFVLLGSGDREKPTKYLNTIQNYFFMIKDNPTSASHTTDTATCGTGTTRLCLDSLLPITIGSTPSQTDLNSKKGWYLRLAGNTSPYPEQVVTGAVAVFGVVYFSTHEPTVPELNACVPKLGTARAYGVRYKDASPGRASGDLFVTRLDAGLTPDLFAGNVIVDGQQRPVCGSCDGGIEFTEPPPPNIVANPAKIRSYWFIQK
jgi:type IV pilus assembly protein PilY1